MALSVPPTDKTAYRGTALLVIEVVLTPLALAFTVIRVGLRTFNRQLGWDDAAISAAMIFRLISFCFTMISLKDGNGRHEEYLPKESIMNIIKWTWGNEVLIFVTVCLIKISICLFILRIKKTGWLRYFLYTMMAGLIITNGSCVIILFAQCRPLYAFWDRSAGTCWNVRIYNGFIYAAVGYSVLTDLICSLLPLVILWNVKISPQMKASVSVLMSLGLVYRRYQTFKRRQETYCSRRASGCAAVRAALSAQNESNDLTWALIVIDDWAFCEADLGIIAANLALSRMVYLFFRNRRNTANSIERTQGYRLRSLLPHQPRFGAYMKSANRAFRPLRGLETDATSNDQIPLDSSTIIKTTEFDLRVREENSRAGGHRRGDWFEDRDVENGV